MAGRMLGPYRIEDEIGAGGMGRVYSATLDRETAGLAPGTRVALKVVHPHLLETEGFFKRFLREAQIGSSVDHPNVVRTYDADALIQDDRHWHFLVMEYVEGQTLRQMSDDLGTIPEELCRHIAVEVCNGLAAIHARGVVHRDLKPENVLVTPDNRIKVMDLGVARLTDEALRLSRTGAFVGSVEYAAPEQFRGGWVTAATDLHALGVLLYELASGVHPYRADDFRTVMHRISSEEPRRLGHVHPQVSAFFEEVVHTLLAKNPADRFASAEELRDVLVEGEAGAWWLARATAVRAATRSPLRRVRVPRETAVYGREDELAALRDRFARATAGDGQVVLIEGEAGIGKTRLVDELIDQLRRDGEELQFLFASYPPGGAATAAGAFSTAFREHFGAAGSAEYLPAVRGLVHAFDALLRGEPPPDGAERLTRDSLQTCFVHATRALAAEKTTVVLIDDLHFAPHEALPLFSALAAGVADHRVLLIGTTRRGISQEWVAALTRSQHATHLQLSRLGPKDLVQLLRDSFHSASTAELLAAKIAMKSDGNPFFVFEIIRGLREGQFLKRREDGSWVSTALMEEVQIPSSVLELVNARVASLDEADRDLLDLAACCGFEFDPLVVARALGLETIPALKSLRRVELRHRLVRAAGRSFVFDHHQVQEWLYSGLPDLLRESYHALIAGALEDAVPEDQRAAISGTRAVDLADHFLRGASGPRALPYLDAALDHLSSAYLPGHAAALARRALDVPDLLVDRRRYDVLYRMAEWLSVQGRRGEERAASEAALAIAERLGDRPRTVKALSAIASNYGNTARFDECREVCERALRVAGDDPACASLRAGLIRFLGTVSARCGRFDEARGYIEQCLAMARGSGDREKERSIESSLGSLASDLGRFDEAREHFVRSVELSRELGDLVGEGIGLGDLGVTYHEIGDLERAREHLALCHELFVRSGDRLGEANALANIGEIDLTLGDAERARDLLHGASALAHEIGFDSLTAFRDMILGTTALQRGDLDEAEPLLAAAREGMERHGTARDVLNADICHGELLIARGRYEEARTVLEAALRRATTSGAPNETALAAAIAARLDGADPAAAARTLAEHAPRMRLRDRMRAHHSLWLATGDDEHLAAAHELLTHLREHAPEAARASMLTAVPLHRAIETAWRDLRDEPPHSEHPTLAG